MNWTVNQSIMIGNDHIFAHKNCQDFQKVAIDDDKIIAIVCDGCSEGDHSEVGANLLGNLLINRLKTNLLITSKSITDEVVFFNDELLNLLHVYDRVNFIKHNFLSTFIFSIIDLQLNTLFIGRCGDGITIINDIVNCVDHDDKPHYLAYANIPDKYLTSPRSELEGLIIKSYDLSTIKRIVIASDGLKPLLDKTDENCCLNNLYGNSGRQLQRRFNVWQQKTKMFYDDTSCIVIEKCEIENAENK